MLLSIDGVVLGVSRIDGRGRDMLLSIDGVELG